MSLKLHTRQLSVFIFSGLSFEAKLSRIATRITIPIGDKKLCPQQSMGGRRYCLSSFVVFPFRNGYHKKRFFPAAGALFRPMVLYLGGLSGLDDTMASTPL